MKKCIVLGMLLVLAISSCSKENSASAAGSNASKDITDPHVVAVVGSEKIMDSDVDAFLSQIPEQARMRYTTPEGKKEFITSLAEVKMMSMAAKKQGLDKTAEVKRRLDFINEQILAKSLAETALKEIKISDEDISKYYNENKEKFATGPTVKLRHILVPTEAEAKAILAELKKGADFSKLAKEKSKCPSSQQGGDLGTVTKGSMVPEFEKAAFELKKGQTSGIVKTTYGYHIIRCDDAQATKQIELSEAKPSIEQQLKGEKSEAAIKELIEKVKKDYPVTMNESYFKKAAEEAVKSAPAQPAPAPGSKPEAK